MKMMCDSCKATLPSLILCRQCTNNGQLQMPTLPGEPLHLQVFES